MGKWRPGEEIWLVQADAWLELSFQSALDERPFSKSPSLIFTGDVDLPRAARGRRVGGWSIQATFFRTW